MKSGKAVYVEKPMASNYEDCCRINRIAEKTNVPCFVAYYRRYLPYFIRVKELVQSGVIGNVINVQIRFAVPPRDLDYNSKNLPWRVQPDIAGAGIFMILLLIRLIYCRKCLDLLLRPKAIRLIWGAL